MSVELPLNVRRYVQLAQSRGSACYCTRSAMQEYNVILFIVALAKTVTNLLILLSVLCGVFKT